MATGSWTALIAVVVVQFVAGCSTYEIIRSHDFKGVPESYRPFPQLYYSSNQHTLQLVVTERFRRSHHDSGGRPLAWASSDCGLTWTSSGRIEPPLIFKGATNSHFNYVTASGWRRLKRDESAPKNAFVWEEGGERYAAQGIVERSSTDGGATWNTVSLAGPASHVVMNYNVASHLTTSLGTRLTALYMRKAANARSEVFVARREASSTDWQFLPVTKIESGSSVGFDEAALVELPDGRLIAFMRPDPDSLGVLYYSVSDDDGRSWREPVATEIRGYPASALVHEGRLIVTVGSRRERPYQIVAYILDAKNMAIESRLLIDQSTAGNPSDFGYPITILCNENIITAFYLTDDDLAVHPRVIVWTLNDGNK